MTNLHINNFKQHLTNNSKSPNTIINYIHDLEVYFSLYPILSRENIQNYKQLLLSKNTAPQTINRRLSSLKQYNEYLVEQNITQSVIIIKSDYIKIQSSGNPIKVTIKQVSDFLSNIDKSNKLRDRTIIHLIANTGIRREECVNIKLDHLDLDNNQLTIYYGKGGKSRNILLNDFIVNLLKQYITTDRITYSYFKISPYLFVSQRGIKLCNETINALFKQYGGENVTPHQLRHNYATYLHENNILSIKEIQDQLGHTHISTTLDKYTHARPEVIHRKIHDKRVV